jgi:predicted Rossmann fold flavoprotein
MLHRTCYGTPYAGVQPRHLTVRRGCRRLYKITCHLNCQVAVIGGGAAGLTAAYFAAEHGCTDVLLLEKNSEPGRKILISGGTRCNVLPGYTPDFVDSFYTESSRSALKAVFSSWTLEACQEWLSSPRAIGIPLALEPDTAKLFPQSNSAQEVRDKLVAACVRRGVTFKYGAALTRLQPSPGGGWDISTAAGGGNEPAITAQRVVLATGGKSFPALGSSGIGYEVCEALGHSLHPTYPALTPLLGSHPGGGQLAGLSMYDVQLSVVAPSGSSGKKGGGKGKGKRRASQAQRTAMLFTHRGFSGPAVLDLSHHVVMALERASPDSNSSSSSSSNSNSSRQQEQHTSLPALKVDWVQDRRRAEWEEIMKDAPGATLMVTVLKRAGLAGRLAEALCIEAGLPLDRRVCDLRKEERVKLQEVVCGYTLNVTGHEG